MIASFTLQEEEELLCMAAGAGSGHMAQTTLF